ncbi:Hint domain-containing protein [Parasedimentitalea maritima]|uniref:Hedgehog/Intein (Hint) domain-containing protein n=1 Tax=Parasedimentitalea maritima TaxID=2578117 RepID=A0A6A4RIN9_9RHOB|nr:Hint domain-containing protein [Zongyanglinia marina]KAE9631572.1 hypothetical protein GP644_04430 [Zongyanglinia marina]
MAIEVLTVTLGVDVTGDKIEGTDLISGDKDDNQIVTIEDGGDLSGNYVYERWGKGTPTEAGAGPGGDDEFHIDLSGFDDDFSMTVKSMDPGDCFVFTGFDSYSTVGNVWTFDYTGSDGQSHSVSIDVESANGTGVASVVVCFVRGSRILTAVGELPVEQLERGDQVFCGDGKCRPIQWIGSAALDGHELRTHPELCPIRFAPNSLAPGSPVGELMLSPQHRVLLKNWRAEMLFGEPEVLVTASSLTNDDTIRPVLTGDVEYFHILLEGHHTVWANGVECETLMPAEMAQTALSGAARGEICQLFPEIVTDLSSFGSLCHPLLKPYETQTLLE